MFEVMKRKINYILFFTSLILTSCATVNEFTINIQKPAKIIFPNETSKIVIANNSAEQPENINHRSYKFTQEVGNIVIPADGLGNLFIESLTDNLAVSGSFTEISIEQDLPKDDLSFLSIRKLEKSTVDSILTKYNSDLLLTLDRYVILLNSDMENVGDGMVRDFYAVQCHIDLSMYDKSGNKRNVPLQVSDTLYWSQYTQGPYFYSEALPSFSEALQGAISYMGEELAQNLVPQWVEAPRWVYSNATTEMRRANVELNSQKWEEARGIWTQIYDNEHNASKKARLASNIALTYELSDNLNLALEWAEKAESIIPETEKNKESEDFQRIIYYKKELGNRILDFKLLDLQEQQ